MLLILLYKITYIGNLVCAELRNVNQSRMFHLPVQFTSMCTLHVLETHRAGLSFSALFKTLTSLLVLAPPGRGMMKGSSEGVTDR